MQHGDHVVIVECIPVWVSECVKNKHFQERAVQEEVPEARTVPGEKPETNGEHEFPVI